MSDVHRQVDTLFKVFCQIFLGNQCISDVRFLYDIRAKVKSSHLGFKVTGKKDLF